MIVTEWFIYVFVPAHNVRMYMCSSLMSQNSKAHCMPEVQVVPPVVDGID